MPKETDEEKAVRSAAIRAANLGATEVPFHTVELCLAGLKAAKMIVGKSNPNAASDLGVAILNLTACIKGAWLNVMINLPGVKDEEKAAFYSAEGKKMYDEADAIASGLYESVAASL
jgi:formiminotetrahydrofolate cyclodeaminase